MSDKCQCIIPYNDNRIGYCLNKATVRIGDKNLCDQHAPSLSNPPISREDLEIVCEAAEGWAGECEAYSDLSRKNAATIRAAVARVLGRG